MNAQEWLLDRIPSFRELSAGERDLVRDFALLWSLFEGRVLEGHASPAALVQLADRLVLDGRLRENTLEEPLLHFRHRYIANGEPTKAFAALHFRHNDQAGLVADALSENPAKAEATLAGLLLIVWRLRNNLFHGEKWAYGIRDQGDNFHQANSILMLVLDMCDLRPLG